MYANPYAIIKFIQTKPIYELEEAKSDDTLRLLLELFLDENSSEA